jgi:PAS domain S-box-containing protein
VEPVPLANGKIRQYLSHKFPVPTPEGRFCLGGFAVDITERQEFEEKIQAERNLLQRLIDSVPDYIFVKDRQSRYILLNQAVAQIFNLTDVSAGLGQLDDRFFPKDVAERYREEDRRVMESGIATYDREDTVVNAAGETRWCLTSKIPLRDAEGKIVGLIGLVRDVTEKRGLEHQFLRSQRLESIGMLAGGIAHDLNNVFAPIILGLDLLKEREGQDKEILDSISASSLRGAALVSQILSFARGMEGPRVSVSPWKLVQDVAKIARETFPRNIRVEVEGTADGWTLAGDPTQLHQVLMNLAVNARDAMLQGGTLKLRLSNVSSDGLEMERVGEFVKIEIADTGVGIPAPIRERIFEPFFTTKEPGKGTGLGLSTVKTIVKNHQGHLEMWSETGQGTQIFVYLPAEKKITPAAALSDRLSPRRGRGELILLVDDEVSIQAITGHALEASGYRVRLASDGAAALTEYAQYGSEIEVVITDMIMPVMDGAELIRALRQLNPKVRILASSGLTDAANLKRLAEAGVRHFITKPYEAKTLLQKLEEVLDEKQSN